MPSPPLLPATAHSEASVGPLLRIRWLAVPGQLLVFWFWVGSLAGEAWIGWAIPLTVAISNEVARRFARKLPALHLAASLIVLDSALLTLWLWHTGGAINPFTLLYLTLIALASLVLGPFWTFLVAGITSLEFGLLLLAHRESATGHAGHQAGGLAGSALDTHLDGMFLAFLLAAFLTAFFVSGLRRELDARELELARERLDRSRAERLAVLSTMIGTAAHELSTPVATLALAGEEIARRLAQEPNLASELEPELEAVRTQSARCRKILDGLAERAGDPRGELFRELEIAELLLQVTTDLAEGQQPRLFCSGETKAKIFGPPRALTGALAALVGNAFDASAAEGPVEIVTKENPLEVEIAVLDRGPGLTLEQLERMGEPFFTTKRSGLGLGLFMARSLAGQLGGNIRLENREGGGTRAILLLPRAAANSPKTSGENP